MKNVLLATLIVAVLAAFSAQVFAQDVTAPTDTQGVNTQPIVSTEKPAPTVQETDENKWDFNFSTGWKNKYVGQAGGLCWDRPVVQSDLTIIFPKLKGMPGRFYADLWHSMACNGNLNGNGGDELDYTIGWDGEIWKGVSLNLGISYFDCIHIGTMPENGDQLCFSAKAYRRFEWKVKSLSGNEETTLSLTPSVLFQVPYGPKGYQDNSGLRVYPGLDYSWEFVPKWSLNQKVSLCLDDGAMGMSPTTLADYRAGLDWRATKWLTVEPLNFRIISPLTSVSDGRKTETVFGLGLSLKF